MTGRIPIRKSFIHIFRLPPMRNCLKFIATVARRRKAILFELGVCELARDDDPASLEEVVKANAKARDGAEAPLSALTPYSSLLSV